MPASNLQLECCLVAIVKQKSFPGKDNAHTEALIPWLTMGAGRTHGSLLLILNDRCDAADNRGDRYNCKNTFDGISSCFCVFCVLPSSWYNDCRFGVFFFGATAGLRVPAGSRKTFAPQMFS